MRSVAHRQLDGLPPSDERAPVRLLVPMEVVGRIRGNAKTQDSCTSITFRIAHTFGSQRLLQTRCPARPAPS